MAGQTYGNFIGEDPETTIIKWDPNSKWCVDPNNDTDPNCRFVLTNGVAYMQFARITWDGSYKTNAIFTHHWEVPVNVYSGRGYHHDEILKNSRFGIRVGWNTCDQGNCATAEWFVSRVWFYNAWAAGFSIEGWNNLDWNLRHCIFYNCSIATTNWWGSGNYHVSESGFYYCGVMMQLANCLYYSNRDNFIYETPRMLWTQYYGCRTQFLFARNTFIAPDGTFNNATNAIYSGEDTSITLIDNTFIYPGPPYNQTIVTTGAGYYTTQFFYTVGNTFAFSGNLTNALAAQQPWVNIINNVQYDNKVFPADKVKWEFPVHPGFQKLTTSPIIYANASLCDIPGNAKQCYNYLTSLIAQATALRGQRPIIYFHTGIYGTNQTLIVPPNSDIQFVGKDLSSDYTLGASAVVWSNPQQAGYIFTVQGPTKVTFRSLTISGYVQGSGILFQNVDQEGARMYGEQSDFHAAHHNMVADGVDWIEIDQHAYYAGATQDSTGTVSRGGPCSAIDKGTSRIALFSGASGGSSGQSLYEVYNGGKMLVESVWWEQGSIWVHLNSSHSGTIQLINLNTGANNSTVWLDGFKGKFSLVNAAVANNINITKVNEDSHILFLQCARNNDTLQGRPFGEQNYNPGKVAFIQNWFTDTPYLLEHYPPPDEGNMNVYNIDWLRDMLSFFRSVKPSVAGPITRTAPDVSDIRLYRVNFWNTGTGMTIQGDGSNGKCPISSATSVAQSAGVGVLFVCMFVMLFI
eukprot:Phypoly_transcript_03170.p1 GENE.Phypoly_transcript_03170~~Phypoly_transcript_03170.p1  ORF type:complete len:744 (+),score=93.92 Phypoly_transcript_03170:299-2530(+)